MIEKITPWILAAAITAAILWAGPALDGSFIPPAIK